MQQVQDQLDFPIEVISDGELEKRTLKSKMMHHAIKKDKTEKISVSDMHKPKVELTKNQKKRARRKARS